VESSDEDEGDFGTFVVRKGRDEEGRDDDEEDGEGGEFGTFVVRKTGNRRRENDSESVSGTFVRRTSSGGGGSTMSRAVASMQAMGDLGFPGRNRKSMEDGSQLRQLQSKMSSSSIPDCISKEDPSTKYILLHELGKLKE